MGRGVFYEVSHAIAHCTNASGGLSAIAEFPVVVMGMNFELLAGSLLSLKSEGSAITVKLHDFFYRATVCVSVVFDDARCPSVSVWSSVTLVHCIHMAEDIVELLSQPRSPVLLVFLTPAPVPNSKGTPTAGHKVHEGGKILRFSTEIAVYLANGTR